MNKAWLILLPAAVCLAVPAVAAPTQLTGQWKCMRSVVSASSMYQPMLTFSLSPGSWTDLTFGPARARKGRASYANGDLKLFSANGSLLHTLRWTAAGDGGASERLVEVLGPNDRSRAGEVCYSAAGSSPPAAAKPVTTGTGLRPGGDPYNVFAYPAHVALHWGSEGVPMDAVATFTLSPADGGATRSYTRTVRQLHSSPAASYKVPVDQTATLIVPAAGRYRLKGTVQMADGRTQRLLIGGQPEAEIEWTGTYLNGAKYLGVTIAE